MNKIENKDQAMVQALALAITAPTNELAQECAAIAESLAVTMSKEQIKKAKSEALKIINGKKEVGHERTKYVH